MNDDQIRRRGRRRGAQRREPGDAEGYEGVGPRYHHRDEHGPHGDRWEREIAKMLELDAPYK